jgi:hypothetical protein
MLFCLSGRAEEKTFPGVRENKPLDEIALLKL